jgi:hypothetical protein
MLYCGNINCAFFGGNHRFFVLRQKHTQYSIVKKTLQKCCIFFSLWLRIGAPSTTFPALFRKNDEAAMSVV